MDLRLALTLVTMTTLFLAMEGKRKQASNTGYNIDGYLSDDGTLDWFIELRESIAEEETHGLVAGGAGGPPGDQFGDEDQPYESWFDWNDWADFNSIWQDQDWNSWDVDWDLHHTEPPKLPFTYAPQYKNTESSTAMININDYWRDDPWTDFCKDDWISEPISHEWQELIDEFVKSGNITNWCTSAEQVMVMTDLSNVNLNDPAALPRMFRSELELYCSVELCRTQSENRKQLDPGKLVARTLRMMDIYRRIDCVSCFCSTDTRDRLGEVIAITKDHLIKNEFLRYVVTSQTPEDVVIYFKGLEASLGLKTVKEEDLNRYKTYVPLLDMDQAIEGPGQIVLQIYQYQELGHGLYNFCGK